MKGERLPEISYLCSRVLQGPLGERPPDGEGERVLGLDVHEQHPAVGSEG